MKIKRIFGTLWAAIGGLGLLTAFVLSSSSTTGRQFSQVEIKFEYPENQSVVGEEEVQPLVEVFLRSESDSNALKVNTFLLETSLESLPYVQDAQVYWNLNKTLMVEVLAKQAKAKVARSGGMYLLTTEDELLPAPKAVVLDLPVITGVKDSADEARMSAVLDEVLASPAFALDNLAQLHLDGDRVHLTAVGNPHHITANADERLAMDLKKLAAYYAALEPNEWNNIGRIDLRFRKQVVTAP